MKKLLFVDDNLHLLELFEQEFSDDYEVKTVNNGQDALREIRKKRPDLVVIDIQMPGMDGIDLLSRIMAIDKTIPVVINTAYSTYKDNFMTWCADEYVVKPNGRSRSQVWQLGRVEGKNRKENQFRSSDIKYNTRNIAKLKIPIHRQASFWYAPATMRHRIEVNPHGIEVILHILLKFFIHHAKIFMRQSYEFFACQLEFSW